MILPRLSALTLAAIDAEVAQLQAAATADPIEGKRRPCQYGTPACYGWRTHICRTPTPDEVAAARAAR